MGRVQPKADNLVRQFAEINRFRGLKKDETARLLCIELSDKQDSGAWMEWRHNFARDEIKENGVVVQERKWLGTFQCLGDPAVLADKGSDPDGCPACAQVKVSDDFRPSPHYAMNVIRYQTKPGGFELRKPFGVECLVWAFTERTYSALISKANILSDDGAPVDLRQHDLCVRCTNPNFQNYELDLAPLAFWIQPQYNKDGEAKLRDLVVECYKENKADDETLGRAIAYRFTESALLEKVNDFLNLLGHGSVSPGLAAPAQQAAPRITSEQLVDTLGGSAPPLPEAGDDLGSALFPNSGSEASESAESPEDELPVAAPTDSAPLDVSLDDLLA